ncbi:MAG: thioredoxin [Clostridia bacterium]|nr:thioredoxin [Clostridia bacterium]
MEVIKVNTDNFEQIVLKSEKTVLVDFYADWCGPCRMVAPIVEEIATEHPEYLVCKVNVDESQKLAIDFGLVSIPTLLAFKNGKEAGKIVGVRPKEAILEMLK